MPQRTRPWLQISPKASRDEQPENDPALLRFARLKQRESVQDFQNRPGGPKIITSPPKPDKWSVKDTTVNIASAFTQAANAEMPASYNHNGAWASSSRAPLTVPRSTSVEYEAAAPHNISRRLPGPPPRTSNPPVRKPPSKSASLRLVPDSEPEDDNPRGKSPFETSISLAKHALSSAAYYVRQRSRDPEDASFAEQHSQNGTARPTTNGNDSSYDYAAEEHAVQQSQKQRRDAHKRGRMSTDNKAYKPSRESEEEESEWSDDGKTKRRRRKKVRGPAGGPLNNLPVIQRDKMKKKKNRKRDPLNPGEEGEEDEESGSEDITQDISNEQLSYTRYSQEPSYDNNMDISADQGLHSIPEVDEVDIDAANAPRPRRRSRSKTPAPATIANQKFSIGGVLGSIVHIVIKLVLWLFSALLSFTSMFTFLFGQVFGTTFDIILRRPIGWAKKIGPFFKYLVVAMLLVGAWFVLQETPSITSRIPIPSLSWLPRPPAYPVSNIPPADISELSDRLLRLEAALSGLSLDSERTKAKANDGAKGIADVMSRVGSLENKVATDTKKQQDAESRASDAIKRTINGVKHEVEILHSQVAAQQKQIEKDQAILKEKERNWEKPASDAAMDEEARAKLKALEERVLGVEGGVKEALEQSKKASVPQQAPPLSGPAWLSKIGVGTKTGLQIKSTDGRDVTALMSQLVDAAMHQASKDGIGKPDFALSSAGARVIPTLTSPTLEVQPQGFGAKLWGVVSNSGYLIGRPPITAIHPNDQVGECWPMKGPAGQLGVALVVPAFIDEVTIDHAAKDIAFDLRSAPRQIEVWGMVEGEENVEKVKAWKAQRAALKEADPDYVDPFDGIAYPETLPKKPEYVRLTNFTYDIHSDRHVQTFAVEKDIKALGLDFGIVVLRVLNNWGMQRHTCLYRFRVHGQPALPPPPVWVPEEVEGASQPQS